MADATDVPKKYLYKISRAGVFLGLLPNVLNDFNYTQPINSAGTEIVIEIGDTADRQTEAPEPILTEDGLPITDELGQTLLTERAPDIVGSANSKALIQNNNDITVFEFSPNYPNGLVVFSGFISKWKALFGRREAIQVTCLSNGQELDNYLILGTQTLDLSQATKNVTFSINETITDKLTTWDRAGQTFVPGASGINLAGIALSFQGAVVAVDVTVRVYNSVSDADSGINILGQATKSITGPGGVSAEALFTFPVPITTAPGQTYFFTVRTGSNQAIPIDYQNTNAYANGAMYISSYGGGAGGGEFVVQNNADLYFKTYYTGGATSASFASVDPTIILRSIIDSYVARGGTINYAAGTTDLTGTTRSYTFKVNTILEGIKKVLDIAPGDWYWYVDPATDVLHFKQTSTTAAHTMIYGRHIEVLELEASIEGVKNSGIFTGGDVGGGENLYLTNTDATALANNSGRVGLARLTDNRVELSDTGEAILQNFLDANSSEAYITSLTISDRTYDTNLFKLGQTIGFSGFGNFIDSLVLQIVQINKQPDNVTLGVGRLFRHASARVEEIERRLSQVETVDNPSIPS